MSNIIEADYKIVQERTLEVIATEIQMIDSQMKNAVLTGAIQIGNRLSEAKEKIGHGNWENWCKENLNYTASWAAKLMKIASEYGAENSPYLAAISKTDTCADLSISKVFRLLQVPEEEVENFVEEHDISDMKVKELEKEIRKLKSEKEEAENNAEKASELSSIEVQKLHKEVEELKEELQKAEVEKELNPQSEDTTKLNDAIDKMHDEILAKESEIEKLQKKLDKATKDAEKQKTANEEIEKKHKEEIAGIIEQAKAEAMDAALNKAKETVGEKLKEAQDAIEAAVRRAEVAEKNLETANSEVQMKRKINMNLIATLAQEMKEAIDTESDNEKRQDMLSKSRGFIQAIADIFKEA